MDPKTFNILGIVTALSVVLALVVGNREAEVEYEFKTGRYLAGNLDLDQVDSIVIEENESSVTLRRRLLQGSTDVTYVVDRGELTYPAGNAEVNRTLKSLLELRCAQKVSDSTSAHEELGVVQGGADCTSVQLLDSEGKVLRHILIGSQKEGGGQCHVRLASEDAVYLSERYVSVNAQEDTYLDKVLTTFQRTDLESVTVTTPDSTYSIVNPEDGAPRLLNIPDGNRAKGTDYEGVLDAANNVRFAEYEPDSEASGRTFDHTYEVKTRNGSIYTFSLAKVDTTTGEGESASTVTDYWVRVRARWEGEQVTINRGEQSTQEELKEKEAKLLAKDRAAAFNTRHSGWVYKLGSWNAENMTKPMADLLEPADRPIEVSARHILIAWEGSARSEVKGRTKEEALARANEVLAKVLADPTRFAELAAEYSDGPSGPKGGDLGSFQYDGMAQPFSEAAFNMEVDGITPEPVETQFGYHVIQRTK